MPFVLQFSCRVGNNHQIHCLILCLEKKGEQRKKLAEHKPFERKGSLYSFDHRAGILSLLSSNSEPDIDAINGQDDVYLEFVPVGNTHTHMQLLSAHIQPLLPITTHNSLSKEMSCHHFPNWAPFLSCDVHLTARNHCQLIIWSFVYFYHKIQFWIETVT